MKHPIRALALAALALAGVSANAALTTYSTTASFLAATTARGVDTFTDLSTTAATASPLTRTAGTYGYTATASAGKFDAATPGSDVALSTVQAGASITFSGFGPAITAIGGNFFDTGVAGNYKSGTIVITATDADGASFTETIDAATVNTVFGFTSTTSFTSLVVSSSGTLVWPTVDNLVLGQAVTAVPEPANVALLLAGLGLVGTAARRRRVSGQA